MIREHLHFAKHWKPSTFEANAAASRRKPFLPLEYQLYRDVVHAPTMSPGATISGLMRPSRVGPYELKTATVSMSADPFVPSATVPSSAVKVSRVSPEEVAPTVRTFFPIPGAPIVQTVRPS